MSRTASATPAHTDQDAHFLRLAIRHAWDARRANMDPFGAVLVCDGRPVARARDRSVELSDPTAHPEIEVIRTYCREARVFSLEGCTLYCSTEPCPMCSGAIHWARITRVVFSLSQAMLQQISGGSPKPACGGIINGGSQRVKIIGPLLPEEGLAVFEGYNWQPKHLRHGQLFGGMHPLSGGGDAPS